MNATDPRLKDLFDERSRRVHVVADLAERAIARDRANRRRDLTTAAAVGALVLAIAAPVAWNTLRPAGPPPAPAVSVSGSVTATSTQPSPTVTPTPTPTSTPTIRATGSDTSVLLEAPTGPATGTTDIAYVVDGVFHDGDRTISLPEELREPSRVARLDEGVVLSAHLSNGSVLVFVDASGREVRRVPEVERFAVTPDGTVAASTNAGDLLLLDARGAELDRLPAASNPPGPDQGRGGYDLVGVAGGAVLATDAVDQSRSVAWLSVEGAGTASPPSPRSSSLLPLDGLVVAASGAAQLAVFDVSKDPLKRCQELRDLSGLGNLEAGKQARVLWRLCGPIAFHHFSADGSHLLGTGFGHGMPGEVINDPDGKPLYEVAVVVRADDGEVVAEMGGVAVFGEGVRMTTAPGGLTAHVNVGEGRRSLVRCRLSGDCEVVGEARRTFQPDIPEADGPYILSEN